MHKIVFYVPESHLESVKNAVFEAGAGRFPNYEHCCWQVLGQGHFKPKKGSKPYIGQEDALSIV
ncbi:MAG: NGG1p interacting factor, partial [Gammaproteobacteria bacterium]|nr:NGG1p interacting factor [Gammaproteobacteria bacterium]